MQIIAIQLDIVWESPQANCERVSQLLRANPPTPGALVALPEMFASGFSMDVANAVCEASQTLEWLRNWSRQFGVHIVAGVAVPGLSGKGHNQAVVVDPNGSVVAQYTKLHPFSLAGENERFEQGREIVTFSCGTFLVAPFICYDLRFPEIFRHAAKKGANFMIVIANWPISRTEHWLTLLAARAIENQSWVLGCNRCGRDPNTLYGGRSVLIDPMGVIRADAGAAEGLLIADADIDIVSQTRQRLPFFGDMRDDFLAPPG